MEHGGKAHAALPAGAGRASDGLAHLALDGVQALGHAAGGDDAALRIHLARPGRVAATDLQLVQAQALGQVVHLGLDGERALEVAVAPHGARVGIVGVDDGGVEAHGGDAVESGRRGQHHVGRGRAPGDVGAVVDHHAGVAREESAVPVRGGPQVDHARLAGRARDELLDALEGDLHGPAGPAGQERRDDVDGVEIEPAAEVAAHRRLDHAHPVTRDAQRLGEVALVEERHLRGAPHGQAGVRTPRSTPGRDGHHGAQAGGGDVVEPVAPLDHDVGLGEGRLHVAVGKLVLEVDQVAAELVVDQGSARTKRRVRIEDGGQLLVVDPDESCGFLRDLFGEGGHSRDLVPDAADLAAVGRATLEGQVILGEADGMLLHAVGGDDGEHARERLGGARVDAAHPRVGILGPQNGPVGHAWQDDVVEELCVSGDLLGAVALRGVLADDAEAHRRAPRRGGDATRPSSPPGSSATRRETRSRGDCDRALRSP